MLIVLFTMQGNPLYKYYYTQALNPNILYYKNLLTSNETSYLYQTTDIFFYFENTILPNFFPFTTLNEISNIWIGPMQIRQVNQTF